MDSNAFEVNELLGDDKYTRLDISLAAATPQGEKVGPAMDNALQGNLTALQDKAKQLIDTQRNRIDYLKAELAKPKAAITPKANLPETSLITRLLAASRID
jgi:hypothetical protein